MEQTQRVEALLATFKDILASLSTAHAALENEISLALEPGGASDAPATAEHGAALTQLALENTQLREALESRALIEQAKGILMGRYGCDPDSAFELLGAMSRRQRRKVRHIAASLVERTVAADSPRGRDPAAGADTGTSSGTALGSS